MRASSAERQAVYGWLFFTRHRNAQDNRIASLLEIEAFTVSTATSGAQALAALALHPALVLLDIMMPDMDGHDTMQAIRRTGNFRDLPIIAVTAKAMKGDREKTLQAGAWDYLAKPVDTDEMIAVLRSWLCR